MPITRSTLPDTAWLQPTARAALALLAFALPFEPVAPLARVGPLQLTSLELILYVALALSAAAIAAEVLPEWKRLPWQRIAVRHAGVLAFALVLVLSAARAPVARPDAVKFALRGLGGIALYVAASNLLRAPTAALTTAVAMSIGAVVAAILMWAELHVPGTAAALAPFHYATFDVFGLARAAGPFQYPNIAAMYLEGTLPVVLAAGVAFDAHRGGARFKTGTLVATLGALVVVFALSLTASRAAMLTAMVVVAGVALHALIRRTRPRWQAPAVLAVLGLLAVANTAAGSLVGLRMRFWNDAVWYRSVITPVAVTGPLRPGAETTFEADVRNSGARPWPAAGPHEIALSYHWRDEAGGNLVVFDGLRTALPRNIEPGATVRVNARVRAPDLPGRYRLHLEMVHEGITWFGQQGDAGTDAVVDVAAQAPPDGRRLATVTPPPEMAVPLERATRAMLWRAAFLAWREHPLLGLGPDNFRRAYNRYLGLPRPDERLHANNLYFETLASLGLAGLAALALLVIGLAGAARTAVRHHGAASVAGLIAAGAATGLAAYLVHGFFDYFLEFTPTYGLLWLLAGLVSGLATTDRKATE